MTIHARGIRPPPPTCSTCAHPAFARIATARTLGAIGDLAPQWASGPKDWGAFFLLFPAPRPWTVPWKAWHIDHPWTAPARPLSGLKVHSVFGPIEPRAGGMTVVAGSHHLLEATLRHDSPPPGDRPATTRARVMRSCDYLRVLGTDGRGDERVEAARITRFVDVDEEVLGCRVQVRELTADAGDVFLIHPLLLHTRPTTPARRPVSCSTRTCASGADRSPDLALCHRTSPRGRMR